jgi:hypothetical protein
MNKLSLNQASVNLDVIYLEALATINSSLPEERRFEFKANS